MIPRVFGIETEYGLMTTGEQGTDPLDVDQAAYILFEPIVKAGRSTNTFLKNGSRLYLDVGSHPEYATAECDNLADLLSADCAGDRIFVDLLERANSVTEGHTFHLFKNNVDAVGNSFGCHENYLIRRRRDFRARIDALVPFFITRQILVGAGHVRRTSEGCDYAISQRADQVWDAISSATTRSRPIVNTRDEPHGNPEKYRRLHVIVGDSNMSQYSTALKVATVNFLLCLVDEGALMPQLAFAEPMVAIRDISHDLDLEQRYEMTDGRHLTAREIQMIYYETVCNHLDAAGYLENLPDIDRQMLRLWGTILDNVQSNRERLAPYVDWIAKYQLLERYRAKSELAWDDPRLARLELAYHDISSRGLSRSLHEKGVLASIVSEDDIQRAVTEPPQSTRARIRGTFVDTAERLRKDVLVDWTTLRLMDGDGSRTVILNDPFETQNDELDSLMESMCGS